MNNMNKGGKGNMLIAMLMGMGFCSIPHLVKLYVRNTTGRFMYKSNYELVHEILISLVCLPIYLANVLLILSLGNFYTEKKKQKQAVLQMLDSKYKFRYNLSEEEKRDKAVPLIVKHSASSQLQLFKLYRLINNNDFNFVKRCERFASFVYVIYSLPFFYICFLIILAGKKFKDIGINFCCQTLYNTVCILLLYFNMLISGAQANGVDEDYKFEVMALRIDCAKTKIYTSNESVYSKDIQVKDPKTGELVDDKKIYIDVD